MKVRCLEDFKAEFERLISNSTYKDLKKQIIEYFFDRKLEDLCSGTRLNGSAESPYIKKRLKGSGGYRVYFLVVIKDDTIYLMFVHPKSGSKGADNITNEFKAALYKKVYDSIKSHDFYDVTLSPDKKDLLFARYETGAANTFSYKTIEEQL